MNLSPGIALLHGCHFNKAVVLRYRLHLEDRHLAAGTINVRLAAVRRLAYEAEYNLPLAFCNKREI